MSTEGHPVAWWIWAIGVAAFASFTTNPWLTVMVVLVACLVHQVCRSAQPWAEVFRIYLVVAAAVVVTRLLFRVLLGGGTALYGDVHVVLDLPQVPLPDWMLGIQLFGPITLESLLAGLYDGLRLAAIIVCIGAANSLANPKRLMRHLPAALYEVGTAIVVAVNVLPQLAASLRRVRRAQQLRAGDDRRVGRLKRLVIPVLEDALDRSMTLAAGMDSRGYGRTGSASVSQRRIMTTLMLVGLGGICVGAYASLDATVPGWLGIPMLLGGLAAIALALAFAGIGVTRSVYRPDRWRATDVSIATSGVACGVLGWWVQHSQVAVAYPSLAVTPTISGAALLAILLAAVPALVVGLGRPAPVATP